MSRLVTEGWVAPADPGPTRRATIAVLASSVVLMLAWLLAPGVGLSLLEGDRDVRTVRVRIDDRGRATIDGARAATEVRTSRGTRFLVVQVPLRGERRVRARIDAPVGVEEELVAVRVLDPPGTARDGKLLVTMPASGIRSLDKAPVAGSLGALTSDLDADIRAERRDRRLERRVRAGWWWITLLGVLTSAGVPLWTWRRERRRFLDMRVPGPGRKIDTVPPSSLDPVGAAVLMAGARPIDATAAFAGHVLDLVERRQVRMRRNTRPDEGRVGAQLGLAHAEEERPEDIAVAALRTVVREDEVTVELPDDTSAVRKLPDEACAAWHQHVAARARFERASVGYPAPSIAAAATASVAFAIAGVAGALLAPYPGGRIAGALVVALALPLAIVLGAWARDARRWRVVARARRNERAQWVAWRQAIGTVEGASIDPRNIPLAVATGPLDGLLPDHVMADAVGMDAITPRAVAALRAMCAPARG